MNVIQSYIDTMEKCSTSICTMDVQRFCGFANYHHNFIKNFATIAAPLYEVTGKNKFQRKDEHQEAFEQLKLALTNAPVLSIPTKNGQFILYTYASEIAISAELIQVII
jgi:hypothetical protein